MLNQLLKMNINIKMNKKTLRTPFWTFNSGTRYSFINAGKTVKGAQVSATIAIKIEFCVKKYI